MSTILHKSDNWLKKTIAKLKNNKMNKKLKYYDNKWDKKLRGKK